MDFTLLFDDKRKLFAIGFDERANRLDPSSYDLLASEARLASFIAIAKGDAPTEHWFRLGRSLTIAGRRDGPRVVERQHVRVPHAVLVMPSRARSRCSIRRIAPPCAGRSPTRARGVPWGISESAYNLRDRHDTYQYRAFGVPDLALKRGLANDLVVAPYATVLALAVDPREALRNFAELERHGALGAYGFYDALDYTRRPRRARRRRPHVHGASHRHEPRRARQRAEHRGWRGRVAAAFHGRPDVPGRARFCSMSACRAATRRRRRSRMSRR